MTKDVSLTSQAWCDLIFEGKNKHYGAYALRQKSSDRHLKAVLIVVTVLMAVIVSAKALHNWKLAQGYSDDPYAGRTITMTVVNISEPKPEQQFVQEPVTQPPLKEAIKYTVYKIDKNAPADEDILTQDEIFKSKAIIYDKNIDGSLEPDAVNPHDLDHVSKIVAVERPTGPREVAEVMPSYPGGDAELMRYLSENLKYPVVDIEQGSKGRVVLRFVVGEDGRIRDIKVIRSVSSGCDKEAIRVVKGMSNWIPGRQNGVAVPVYFSLPILFQLQN